MGTYRNHKYFAPKSYGNIAEGHESIVWTFDFLYLDAQKELYHTIL